jgi:hypothetical protein
LLAQDELPSELYGESVRPLTDERTVRASLYFVRTNRLGVPISPPRLAKVERESEPSTLPEVEIVMDLLLTDPTANPAENEPPIRTAIPIAPPGEEDVPNTELLSISVEDGLANVNLSAPFESAESELVQLMRIAQVVYTLTELPEVDAVRFSIHGATQPVVDQQGMAHETVTREQYSRFAPVEAEPEEVESQVRAD